jgi:hypothetical protein
MRTMLATSMAVAAMAVAVAAQPQCPGMAFDKACAAAPSPKLRLSFGAPLAPASVTVVREPGPRPFALAQALPASLPSATAAPAIDCAMQKHTDFAGDTHMIHVAGPEGRARVISVPSCANPGTPGPKK